MPRWLKHFLFLSLLVVFGGCAGSCSSCAGCGITPIPNGFPLDKRVENSSSVRVTQSGLKFISDNLGTLAGQLIGSGSANGGTITFNVPTSATPIKLAGITLGTVTICPSGPKPTANPPECVVEANLGTSSLTVATAAPHEITVTGTLPVRLQNLPMSGSGLGGILGGGSYVALDNGGKCGPYDYANVPVTVDVSLETDTDPTHAGRKGYTKVVIKKLDIDQPTLESSLKFCGSVGAQVVDALKGLLIGQLIGGLTGSLTSTVQDQLCTKADPATGVTCPQGSTPDASNVCMWADNTCVGMALGTDGKIDLGQMLASLSPGTKGGLDFLGALGGEGQRDDSSGMLWGDLNPINNGMTIGMIGGAEPDPITTCVPLATLDLPAGIPIPDELTANTVPNWTGNGPDLGIAVSERYMNYAVAGAYNSGALCLGIGSSTLGSLLSSNTVSLLIPSLKDLGVQQQPQPLALVIRPQEAPSIVVGNGTDLATDPLLKIALNKFFIDFYVFSSDRYIRAFSASFDLVVPVNLDVTDQGLAPVIDKIEVNNPSVFNDPLLREDEKSAADALAGIVSGTVGSALGGAISPIDLNSSLASLGLTLTIPPTVDGQGSPGLRRLDKGSDGFLGIFATLGVSGAQPLWVSQTQAEVSGKTVDAAGLVLPTITKENVPTVQLRVGSQLDNGARKIEYQYRLDGGFWHPWTTSRYINVRSPILSIQAHHKVQVRSRVVGMPETMDHTPALVDVIIDKSIPELRVSHIVKAGQVTVSAFDAVSPISATKVRWSLDGQGFSDWVPASTLSKIDVGQASQVTVQASDEEGNIATSSQALVRGRADKSLATASACGCRVPGGDSRGGGLAFGLPAILGLGLLFRMRRRGGRKNPPFRVSGNVRGVATLRVVATLSLMALAASWSGCSCGSDTVAGHADAGTPGQCPGLDTCETISPGLIGSYTSVAVTQDGTVWVAGYDDIGSTQAQGEDPQASLFGDLVVGKWDGTKVDWAPIDGLPDVDPTLDPGTTGGPPDPTYYDVNGYRGGLTDPGDDVGRWTSMQLDASGNPMIAYYDATHRALKFASYDGASWAIHTVETKDHADIGRYAKLLIVGGKPVIAYLSITADGKGGIQSGVRVASASSATPAASSDWSFADATSDPATPCRAYLCSSGESCRGDTFKCEKPITGCDPSCASGSKCFDDGTGTPACVTALAASYLDDYPDASGLYISLAQTSSGLGIVYYDRLHGNLMAVQQQGGTWGTPAILDGQATDGSGQAIDTGDKGIGASLFVDPAGDWHVTYADGFSEALMYMRVVGGTTPTNPEIVDSGETADGQAVVGDDSSIVVTASGEVHVAYQDATSGLLRYAVGAPAATGGSHTWTQQTLKVDGFAGAFSHIVQVNGATQVSTWWRQGKPQTVGDVTFVAP